MKKSKFQFSNPTLENIAFRVCDDFDSESFTGIAMESNTEVKLTSEQNAIVMLTVRIGKGDDNQPFDISVTMKANFMWSEEINNKTAKRMLNVNGAAVLLSYIRPIIANMTSSSKYPSLNIPFIDFTNEE